MRRNISCHARVYAAINSPSLESFSFVRIIKRSVHLETSDQGNWGELWGEGTDWQHMFDILLLLILHFVEILYIGCLWWKFVILEDVYLM
jgi:hypothetical protein